MLWYLREFHNEKRKALFLSTRLDTEFWIEEHVNKDALRQIQRPKLREDPNMQNDWGQNTPHATLLLILNRFFFLNLNHVSSKLVGDGELRWWSGRTPDAIDFPVSSAAKRCTHLGKSFDRWVLNFFIFKLAEFGTLLFKISCFQVKGENFKF